MPEKIVAGDDPDLDELENDDEDETEEDDDLADLSDEELRAELKKTRASLKKTGASLQRAGSSASSKRKRIRSLRAELEEARKPKPKSKVKGGKDDDEDDDAEERIANAKREGEAAGTMRAKRAEAKASLLASGVSPNRVARAVGLLKLDDLDLDEDGLDGIDEAIDDLREEWPELFKVRRQKRESIAGGGDRGGDKARKSDLTPSQRQAALVTGRSGQ